MENPTVTPREMPNEGSFLRGKYHRNAQAAKDILPKIAAALELARLVGQGNGDLSRRIHSLENYLRETPLYAITERRLEEVVRQ